MGALALIAVLLSVCTVVRDRKLEAALERCRSNRRDEAVIARSAARGAENMLEKCHRDLDECRDQARTAKEAQ